MTSGDSVVTSRWLDARYGTVQAAIGAAGVNRTTWEKAERGESIREDRLTAIEKALGWNIGDGYVIAEGGDVPPPTGSLAEASDEELPAELRRRLQHKQAT